MQSTLRPFLGQMLAVLTVSLVAPCAHGEVAISTLISFNLSNGSQPSAGLVQGPDGAFYGTTASGGTNYAYGTVFRFTPPPLFLKQWQTNGAFAFTWSTATGQTYQVQFITSLGHTNWSYLGSAIPATNSTATVADPMGTNQQRFYHVELVP
ncbi:MAG: choice-of-anchor tandem repeat GloVer-containing protein [Limisphaerales bacterium]